MPRSPFLETILLLGWVVMLPGCQPDNGHDAVGLLEWERVALSAEVSESITAIQVTKGELVQAGQTILQLDPQRFEARRAQIISQ